MAGGSTARFLPSRSAGRNVTTPRLLWSWGIESVWISDHFHPWLDEQGEGPSCGVS